MHKTPRDYLAEIAGVPVPDCLTVEYRAGYHVSYTGRDGRLRGLFMPAASVTAVNTRDMVRWLMLSHATNG